MIANYRETQLPNIKEGYEVTLTADAVPGVTYTGVVESISDATGAAFSLIPQDNATGNFVKACAGAYQPEGKQCRQAETAACRIQCGM